MGHDISGFNKSGEEIAYARFSMGNQNAVILYSLLESIKYYAGVSGIGDSTTFTEQQIEKALNSYYELFGYTNPDSDINPSNWSQRQIKEFILNCLETTQKEGSVRVYFG